MSTSTAATLMIIALVLTKLADIQTIRDAFRISFFTGVSTLIFSPTSLYVLKENWPYNKKTVLMYAIAFLIGVTVLFSGALNIKSESQDVIDNTDDVKMASYDTTVSARELALDVIDNDVRTGNKYDGKTIKITGKVASIDGAKVVLDGAKTNNSKQLNVNCYFVGNTRFYRIKEGETISLVGEAAKLAFNDKSNLIEITRCELLGN